MYGGTTTKYKKNVLLFFVLLEFIFKYMEL